MKQPEASLFTRFINYLRENEWVYLVVGIMVGLLIPALLSYLRTDPTGFLESLVPEAMGIGFTLLILDRLNERRSKRQIREQLIRQLHSYYNPVAMQALEELRVIGYLSDGTLHNQDFRGADWRDANLYQADLTGCDLSNAKIQKADLVEANLTNAKVTEDQLVTTDIMWKCILPDGSLYNGKYNLPHDFEVARRKKFNPDDPVSMAQYYGVALEDYVDGQHWAQENADKLRMGAAEREKARVSLAVTTK